MIWSIEPSDDVINNNDGSFKFPENASITQYTITCDNEAGCTASTIYNLPQGCGGEPPPSPEPPGPGPGPGPGPSPCTDFAVAGEAFVKCGVVSTAYGGRGTCGYISGECGEPDAISSVELYCSTDGDWIYDLETYYEDNYYKWRGKVGANNTGHDRVAVFKITTTWNGVYYFRTVQAASTTADDPQCQRPGTAIFSGSIRPSSFSDCTSPLSCT